MYNLSEDKHIFLHVTYSMLEEGYDIDEILGMWVLADEEQLSELMESLTLTEEIDLGNQDLEGITRYYFGERFRPNLNFNWLRRLFGKGQKIKPPKVTPKVKPTKPVTTSGGKPVTQGSGSTTTTKPPKVTKNTTGTLADKVKKNAPKIIGGAAVIGGGLLGGSGLIPDEPGNGNGNDNTTSKPGGSDDDPSATDTSSNPGNKPSPTATKDTPAERKRRNYAWASINNRPKNFYRNDPAYYHTKSKYNNIRGNPIPTEFTKDHYEVIADYLIAEGHASDIKEADYVMKQLDEEFIQIIIESSCGSHKKKKKKK